MARSSSVIIAKCSLVILVSSMIQISCPAFVNHHLLTARMACHRPCLRTRFRSQKSSESTFWIAIDRKNQTSPSDSIPATPNLDRETGPLPPGAYRHPNSDDGTYAIAPCRITVGIRPPSNSDVGEVVWIEGVKNCQNFIDSGFNTFRVNDCDMKLENRRRRNIGRRSCLSIALEQMQQRTMKTEARHEAEENFYSKLRHCTPLSILRSCHFMVNMDIPFILSEDIRGMESEIPSVSFGNGWMVRESVSSALLRTKGECLDSVVLEYRNNPYCLDVIDALFEIKREGLIRSISTKNFPPSLLRTCLECGFDVSSNDVFGNLMNTNNLQFDNLGVSRLVSAPLGGGLFTNRYYEIKKWEQLSPSGKKIFHTLLDSCCKVQTTSEFDRSQAWQRYRAIVDILTDLSFRYQVSVESIALRWLLQLNEGESISVGTSMGMDMREEQGGKKFSRQRDLRQVFTFSLEEYDMKQLCKVSDLDLRSGITVENQIDFTSRRLWM
ncbi:hypothetical protein ACHAXA_001005 [Cyclostephanos tholiformis]|uniref:NADP-dependent oxidoreductase domain-containing protein n=1 Tax=Cyclostephanos tholiformis TaxID=382380 RepID=A0ABD3SDX3_9STRA